MVMGALILLWAIMGALMPAHAQSNTTVTVYCASSCADYVDACWGPASDECYACSTSIFQLSSDSGACLEASQHQKKFEELKTDSMDLSGYTSSRPTPAHCGAYTLSGEYTAGDFLAKTFSGLGTNHYALVVRFGVGYIGAWSPLDQMRADVGGQLHTWNYTCGEPSDVCSGRPIDCFKILSFTFDHNSTSISLRFSSLISETNPSVKYWGIRDLVIGAKNCHSKCLTCTGPTFSECLTCAHGYYLLGNTCVSQCDQYAIPAIRKCAESCPLGYFSSGSKLCLKCPSGCLVCNEGQTCEIYEDGSRSVSLWEQHLLFWVLLIILGFVGIFYAFWKCLIKRYIDEISKKINPEDSTLHKKIMAEELKDEEHLNTKDNPSKMDSRGNESRTITPNNFFKESKENSDSMFWLDEGVHSVMEVNDKKKKKRRQRNQEMNKYFNQFEDVTEKKSEEQPQPQGLPFAHEPLQL